MRVGRHSVVGPLLRGYGIRMAIPYQTAKFISTNILAIAILSSTAKFNFLRLYGNFIAYINFKTPRDNIPSTDPDIEQRRDLFKDIFAHLEAVGK